MNTSLQAIFTSKRLKTTKDILFVDTCFYVCFGVFHLASYSHIIHLKLLHMIIYETKQVYTKIGNIDATNLDCPQKVYDYMNGAFDSNPLQEQVFVILLNRKNLPISREQVTIGTTSSCLLDPSTVFRPAILAGASAIILSHNHPSGDPSPSSADMRITKKIKEAGKVLDIDVLDHVIIGENDCYSFQDKGLI